MKKHINLLYLSVLFTFFITGCNNDVNLYADYKEIPVIYGLLDYQNDTIWIKVTKAFSGPGNALEFAKNPDSSNYSSKLEVTLTGRKNGNDLPAIIFDTITIHNKNAGDSIFYYPDQLMYYSTEQLDQDAEYTLKVKLNDKDVTAKTKLVKNFHITYPVRTISFTSDKNINWNSAINGKRYETDMVFHYEEMLPGTSDTLHKTISWHLGMKHSISTSGYESMAMGYSGDNFYKLLENKLEKIPNVQRWTGNIDVIVACASQELDTYIEINNGTSGLLQEIPTFTNINGGVGLFASRHTVVQSVPMTVTSERKLIEDYDLGFKFKQ